MNRALILSTEFISIFTNHIFILTVIENKYWQIMKKLKVTIYNVLYARMNEHVL